MKTPTKSYLCKLHPDFHLPADVDVGEAFDGDAYVKRLKASGVDFVVFFAKCHYGHSYYDTKIGTKHPRLKKDMLAEVVQGCRNHGLGLGAYFSVFLDTAAVCRNPDWALQATSAKTDAGFDSGNYRAVCVNSGYFEALFLPQSIEVATGYDVDELFYDTMTGFNPCYCENCERRFGRLIPTSNEDPSWLEYVAWYRSCYDDFFAKTAGEVHRANPKLSVAFNWEWGVRRPVAPPPHITRLTADLIPTGTVASSLSHYFAGTGYPFDYMTGRFLQGLGDWNSAPPETIKYTAAATIANGGAFYIIDRQLPDGALEERSYTMMEEVFGFMDQRRSVVEGVEHVPELAVLLSHQHLMGDQLQYFPDSAVRMKRGEPFEGVSRMFMHGARHYTALGTHDLVTRCRDYGVVILPEVEYLEDTTLDALEDWVEAGGVLVVTQAASEAGLNQRLLDLAGVDFEGFSNLDYTYFGEGPEPPLAGGRLARVKPIGGVQEIVPAIAPLNAGEGGAAFGHGKAPPGRYEGFALATERPVGEGRVIYVALPIFGEYWRNQNPYLAHLVGALLERALPKPIVKVQTQAQIEMVACRKDDDLIVNLVNHSGRERLLGHWYPLTEYMPLIRGIEVRVRTHGKTMPMHAVPSGASLTPTISGDYAKVTVEALEFMESIVVSDYFKAQV